jgi:transglutaminase-like putative cysteine protease
MSSASETKQLRSLPLVGRLWKQIEALPPPQAEDSLLLRALAQTMVLVGIAATDVAAETQMSFWAIPFSIAGATWSWYNRRKPNVATKFGIAILMLVALAGFFLGLRQSLNDTRLVLAELLVQLQVLHSFDLPRRKDLGYSMVIGLILIGVASTLSQTMTFGLLLVLFLAVALPVLVLDYRSRLGLLGKSYKAPLKRSGMSFKGFAIFLLVILALGLTIFASLPRLPGYQLRAFPVSAPRPEQFQDNQQVINPGYVRQGDATRGDGAGTGQGRQGLRPGQLDENFYYGFDTQINQNLRGQMKPRVVLRVRSQAEGYWRVLAFDRYLGQGWEISRNDKTETIRRPSWLYQFILPRPVTLGRHRSVVQTYTVVSELPNLIPALHQPKELYFPTQQVAIDPEGNLRSPLGLLEGLTYTVVSDVPYRDRTRLGQTPTRYSAEIRKFYLDLPEKIRGRVRQRTEQLLATSPKPITSPYEKALFLTQALKQRYTIQPDLPFLQENEDLVEAFLFKYNGGYPDHFSTALTIMLRSIGIPARLAVGFGPGQFNPFTGLYVVQNTDAYAVTEVFFPNYGWYAFNPIPGHELIPPSIEDHQTFTVLQRFWQWVAGWLPSPVTGFLTRMFATIAGWIGWFIGLFFRGWVGLFTALLVGIITGFLGWLSWQGWKKWQYHRWLLSLPPMERLYQQMLRWLALRGFRRSASQTPLEYAHQSWTSQPAFRAAAIEEISHAYVQWRYGGETPDLVALKQRLVDLKKTTVRR